MQHAVRWTVTRLYLYLQEDKESPQKQGIYNQLNHTLGARACGIGTKTALLISAKLQSCYGQVKQGMNHQSMRRNWRKMGRTIC